MKQQEEEKLKTIPKKSQSSKSLPLDVTSEILSKLPAKSVVRFGCVSKLWSSITTDPYFKTSFQTRPKLLLLFKKGDNLFVFSLPRHDMNPNSKETLSYSTCEPLDSYHVTYPKYFSFAMSMSVHGLICFQKATTPLIWNPTIREFLVLPKLEKFWINGITFFLGYDPGERKHKLMCVPFHKTCHQYWVLTLGSDQEPWRRIKTNHDHIAITIYHNTTIYGQCIKGVLYYEAELANNVRVIMSFDVRFEKFHMIELPLLGYVPGMMKMASYKGKLALVGSIGNNITIWVLEDKEKPEWSSHSFSSLPHYNLEHLQIMSKLIGMTDDGELIYVPKTLLKSFHITYVDPKGKTFRKVEYTGIVDEDFRERNGLGGRRLYGLQYFPNHIDTLVSL